MTRTPPPPDDDLIEQWKPAPFRDFDLLAENGLEPPAKTAHEIAGWIVLAIAVIGIAWAALAHAGERFATTCSTSMGILTSTAMTASTAGYVIAPPGGSFTTCLPSSASPTSIPDQAPAPIPDPVPTSQGRPAIDRPFLAIIGKNTP